MAHGLIVQVAFDDGDPELHQKLLHEEVIPTMSSLQGFQRGVWYRATDGKTGMGTVVFDTEANAQAAAGRMQADRPAAAPRITSAGIYEVVGEP